VLSYINNVASVTPSLAPSLTDSLTQAERSARDVSSSRQRLHLSPR